VARVLIVGCGCRGRELAARLADEGHAVRGTTRDPGKLEGIEAAGVEPVVADPDRLSTLLGHLNGVSLMCWLMGTAVGEAEAVAALHGPRLESMASKLIDSGVRGLVYEAAGSVDGHLLAEGAEIVSRVGEANRMPVAIVEQDPTDVEAWVGALRDGVDRVLGA
jgi:6-phosphogluconate dehydrogenase (decarboxylating)